MAALEEERAAAADGEQERTQQGELLERLLGAQLSHNRTRTEALREVKRPMLC